MFLERSSKDMLNIYTYFNNVPDDKLADGLVLWHALKRTNPSFVKRLVYGWARWLHGTCVMLCIKEKENLGAVRAADVLDMTSAMLVPPMVPTLRCHL